MGRQELHNGVAQRHRIAPLLGSAHRIEDEERVAPAIGGERVDGENGLPRFGKGDVGIAASRHDPVEARRSQATGATQHHVEPAAGAQALFRGPESARG